MSFEVGLIFFFLTNSPPPLANYGTMAPMVSFFVWRKFNWCVRCTFKKQHSSSIYSTLRWTLKMQTNTLPPTYKASYLRYKNNIYAIMMIIRTYHTIVFKKQFQQSKIPQNIFPFFTKMNRFELHSDDNKSQMKNFIHMIKLRIFVVLLYFRVLFNYNVISVLVIVLCMCDSWIRAFVAIISKSFEGSGFSNGFSNGLANGNF